ncbi:MAG: leucine-rich repeat domain-containing protein [Candidatus Paceibacterota bacterium]|jgi:Leucine-rich repeat (LRR) protein
MDDINADATNDNDDDDDTVLASLWEAWKIPIQKSQGWTSMNQWMASPGRVVRDPLSPHRITVLAVSDCHLTSLPPEIGHLSRLRGLHLDSNQLACLPSEMGQLSSLQSLNLSHNQLKSLPPEIGRLSSLQGLYLGDNQLTSLPPVMGRLSSLQGLYLEGNRLTSLPPEIGLLSSLQRLYLRNNQLTSLPPEIGLLSSLQMLYLSHNQLTSLPPEIGQLSSLRELYLSHNQLTSLPPDVGLLSSLQWLYLKDNQLKSIPPEMGCLSSLQWLDLDDNQLTSLPLEMDRLSFLRRLHINNNRLIHIPFIDAIEATICGRENQRLPTVLETTTFPLLNDNDMDMVADDNPSEFSLYFYSDESPRQQPLLSSPIPVADRRSLAKRWPYFRHLLDAGLSEANEGSADLSAYFSVRIGQCLVDYFDGKPVQVSLLQIQDCRDFVAHADYFGLGDTLLFHFCTTKLKTTK